MLEKKEQKQNEIGEMSREEFTNVISDSVEKSVDQAFRKYGNGAAGSRRRRHVPVRLILILAVIAAVLFAGAKLRQSWESHNIDVKPVEDHDQTLQNNGIFGFKAADFAEPILGRAQQEKLLIVEEKDASVNTTVTDAGFLDLGIFSKTQVLTIHGTGEYTIDLSQLTESDISLGDDYVLTVKIPHAALHTVTFDPEKTEIGDISRGWLAFGSMKMTAEQTKEFETAAQSKLETALGEEENMQEADRFAKLTATEEIQKIVSGISPVYKVTVEFEDE